MTKRKIEDGKILIIDDEPGNVRIFKRVLKGAGFDKVTSITDPLKAVETYQKFQPDLILLDLKMPELDGFGVMDALKKVETETYLPILVLTAQREDSARLRALESGAKDFLSKPFDVTEALTRIRNLLEVRLLHNEVRDNNLDLEYRVLKRTQELEDSRMDLIHRLVSVSEYRENSTPLHSVRVSHFSSILAEEMGMPHDFCHLIHLASPLHDIGKVGIPDDILHKEEPTNDFEKKAVEMAPLIGAKILSGSDSKLLQLAESICKTHRENWDGSGYPNGLKGDAIPIEGRIVALCDHFDRILQSKSNFETADSIMEAFEKMTGSGPEKETPDAIKETMKAIEEKSGTVYDPEAVQAFKRALPEIREAAEEFHDQDATEILSQFPAVS